MAVSETQLDYLAKAKRALSVRDYSTLGSLILDVITDSDIVSRREELDMRWKRIWGEAEFNIVPKLSEKALEMIREAMANIEVVDKNLWDVRVSEEEYMAILLGAGASKPAPSNIPVITEFLPELWRRARKLDRDDLNKLASWCEQNNISNIEDLLTAAQIANFSTKSKGILSLLNYFLYSRGDQTLSYIRASGRIAPRLISAPQPSEVAAVALLQDTLQVLFGLLAEPMISAKPNEGHKAIAELISRHKNTTIITTNYDGCIDEAIKDTGTQFEYIIGQPNYNQNDQKAVLVKMHGSINWFYCESCQEMDRYDLGYIREAYQEDKLSYPVIGICKHCGGLSRPMIVPPLSLKFLMFLPLAGLWDVAQIAFERAKVILVVGYSFSDADVYITKMVSRAMAADKNKKLIIVDVDSSLAENVATRLSTHIDNFDRKRVIRAAESCDILLPKLCLSLANKGKAPTGPKKHKISSKTSTKIVD